jgi:ParB family chromosome partitioning protein
MTRRSGLGRGLGALLPTAEEVATAEPGAGLAELDVAEIHPNPRQPRTEFRAEELDELAASIREQGILQPVVVRPRSQGGYELLVGERRLRASKLAGATRVPAIIREADDRQALEQALVENLQRADLQPLEEAAAYRNLTDLFELTQEEVARRMGKSRVYVTNTLRLLDLPDEVKVLMADGRLQAGHARALLGIKNAARLVAAAKRAADHGARLRSSSGARTSRARSESPWPNGDSPISRTRSATTWARKCGSNPAVVAGASSCRSAPGMICTASSSFCSVTDRRTGRSCQPASREMAAERSADMRVMP